MISFDQSRCKLPLRPYQLSGVKTLLAKKRYGLFWQQRLGKCKTIIDTACTLFEAEELDVVVVVCPAQVKAVWLDFDFGEIAKHSFVKHAVVDYKGGREARAAERSPDHRLIWIVTSYEFLRQQGPDSGFPKVGALLSALAGRRWWLVCDETCAVGNWKAIQTKAVLALRKG